MLSEHSSSVRPYHVTTLKIEPPGPGGEMVMAELDGSLWVRMQRAELCDFESFRLAVQKQTLLSLPRPGDDLRLAAVAAVWHTQMRELLFEADHAN